MLLIDKEKLFAITFLCLGGNWRYLGVPLCAFCSGLIYYYRNAYTTRQCMHQEQPAVFQIKISKIMASKLFSRAKHFFTSFNIVINDLLSPGKHVGMVLRL